MIPESNSSIVSFVSKWSTSAHKIPEYKMKSRRRTYHFWEGFPFGVWKDTQYLPMPWPLTQARPFPIEPRLSATGSSPAGALNAVCKSAEKSLKLEYHNCSQIGDGKCELGWVKYRLCNHLWAVSKFLFELWVDPWPTFFRVIPNPTINSYLAQLKYDMGQ